MAHTMEGGDMTETDGWFDEEAEAEREENRKYTYLAADRYFIAEDTIFECKRFPKNTKVVKNLVGYSIIYEAIDTTSQKTESFKMWAWKRQTLYNNITKFLEEMLPKEMAMFKMI